MVSVLAHLLALLVPGLGRDLLPCLVLRLLGLVSSVLLVAFLLPLPPCWHWSTHGFFTKIIVFSMF